MAIKPRVLASMKAAGKSRGETLFVCASAIANAAISSSPPRTGATALSPICGPRGGPVVWPAFWAAAWASAVIVFAATVPGGSVPAIGLATSVSPPGDACGGESPGDGGDGVRVVTSSHPSAVGGDEDDVDPPAIGTGAIWCMRRSGSSAKSLWERGSLAVSSRNFIVVSYASLLWFSSIIAFHVCDHS